MIIYHQGAIIGGPVRATQAARPITGLLVGDIVKQSPFTPNYPLLVILTMILSHAISLKTTLI